MDVKTWPEMEAKNDKETINLLDLLSDSESTVSDIVLTPKKKRVKRRYRPGGSASRERHGGSCMCGRSQTRSLALWLAAVSITFWLLALSWFATLLYSDIRKMDSSIRSVIAGNEGVPDTLQKYHSLSRDLQHNQTIIFTNITDIKAQIANFSTQLTVIQHSLHEVQDTIKAAPELVHVPSKLEDLSREVSSWGGRITDLMSTTNSSKETTKRIQSVQNDIIKNITTIAHSLAELSNATQQPQALVSNESKAQIESILSKIAELVVNVTAVNTTLGTRVEWIKQDQDKVRAKSVYLEEQIANITAKVGSVHAEIEELSNQALLKAAVEKLSADVNSVKETENSFASKIKTLENEYNSLMASIAELQTSRTNITQNTGADESHSDHDATEAPKVTASKTEPSSGPTEGGGEVSSDSKPALNSETT